MLEFLSINQFIFKNMADKTMHLKKERTFVIIKPDGVQRGLMGEVLKRFDLLH